MLTPKSVNVFRWNLRVRPHAKLCRSFTTWVVWINTWMSPYFRFLSIPLRTLFLELRTLYVVFLSVRENVCSNSKNVKSHVFRFKNVHTSNSVETTLSNATSRTILSTKSNVALTLLPYLPLLATMSNEISFFRQSRNKLNMFNLFRLCQKDKNSFDIVAGFGNEVERCFDIVAGVDGS